MADSKPLQGQTWQLDRFSTAAWAFVGAQLTSGAPIAYRVIERGTGREIHTLTPEMVASLLQEGWIERDGTHEQEGNARRWGYRITLEGIRARDRRFMGAARADDF